MAITGTPAALASARTSPNRSGMVFRCSSARARANKLVLARHVHWTDVADRLVQVGLHLLAEVCPILDDSRDEQRQAAPAEQPRSPDGHPCPGESGRGRSVVAATFL